MATQIAQLLPDVEGDPVTFDYFWSLYPRKAGKKESALNSWDKLNQADQLAAVNGVMFQTENNPQWRDKTLIPHPSTFLNGRRWEDEIARPQKEELAEKSGSITDIIWSMGVQFFGQSWITKHGDRPSPAWLTATKGMTTKDISRGLRHLIDAGEPNPPSLPRFIQVCKSNSLPEFQSLPKPESDPAIAERAFEEFKKMGIL